MYGFREGSSDRAGSTAHGSPLGTTAISLLMVAGLMVAGSGCAPTTRAGSAGRQRPVATELPPIETSYIGYMVASTDELLAETPIVLERPTEEGRAAAYARRYKISNELALDIVEHALAAGLDPELAFRLVRVESVFKVSARGPQGALGLTQLMPSTASALDRSLDTEREVLDPDRNLPTGFRYLRQMIERYDDVRLGLLAYNRGQTAVDRALRRGTDPENGYSHKVLGTRGSNPYHGPGLLPQAEHDANPS